MMTHSIGKLGEDFAVAHLTACGYDIIERNWHCQWGEIDIVARTDSIWVFCEVKTRKNSTTQRALMNITPAKRKKMVLAAQQYLHEHDLDDAIWRIDAIAVAITNNGQPEIDHVEDALDW